MTRLGKHTFLGCRYQRLVSLREFGCVLPLLAVICARELVAPSYVGRAQWHLERTAVIADLRLRPLVDHEQAGDNAARAVLGASRTHGLNNAPKGEPVEALAG